LLAKHPYLQIHSLGASPASAGKKYKDAVNWKQSTPMEPQVGEIVVQECKAALFSDCDVIFSGLDSKVAGDVGTFGRRMILLG
jgi:aspartate-semialdehyde dehydrogenase